VERVSVLWPLLAFQRIGAYAECPAGKKLLSGGWFGPGTNEAFFAQMEPFETGYSVIVESTVNYNSYIRVTVICASSN
jgi:hypothetical protein